RNRNLGLSGQLYFNTKNTLNFSASYGTTNYKNQGVGGFNLPERASNSKGNNRTIQLGNRTIFSTKLLNEARFLVNRSISSTSPVTDGVAINVLDAFYGGGGQNRSDTRRTIYQWGDTLRWTATPKLNVQTGVDFGYNKNHSVSENNFVGTFTFSSLDDYLAGHPITFRKNSGDPTLDVSQLEFSMFLNMDYRLSPKVNLSMGARYQAQTNLRDYNNVAPTLGFAYQPKQGTVIRAGARLSHQ